MLSVSFNLILRSQVTSFNADDVGMDFGVTRMLQTLEAQDFIIAAKTEQSERTNRTRR